MPDRPNYELAEIPRGARKNLRIMLRDKRGQVACELKVTEANVRGVMVETPRGARVPLVRLQDTITASPAAELEAQRLGLLPMSGDTAN
jgi:hypothetical protein